MSLTNPIKLPANLTSAKPGELFAAIAANINDVDVAESTQRNYIIRCLAAIGYGRSPKIMTGQMDGSRVRLYLWEGTPIGDVVLVTGPSWRGKFVHAADVKGTPEDGFWFAASADTSAAGRKVDEARERASKAAETAQRAIRREEEKAPAPARTSRPAAAAAPAPVRRAPPAPVDTEAAERAELRSGIASLADLLK